MTDQNKKKIFVLAGEASGDLHGSHVVKKLTQGGTWGEPCDVVCWGGDLMAAAGGRLLSHYKERAYMGLWEVIRNLRSVSRFLNQAKVDILQEKPDVLLLIDNPGFNLRIAKWAKSQGIPVHFYIAPKAWAYNEGRIVKMRQVIDRLYVIFPFEVDFFEKRGMPCTYVGNPILEAVDQMLQRRQQKNGKFIFDDKLVSGGSESVVVLLMPGSRKNEVRSLLPVFIRAAQRVEGSKCIVAGAPGLDKAFYDGILQQSGLKADVVFGATYDILCAIGDGKLTQIQPLVQGLALVASGTATLETALFGVPQVVAYKVNWLTYGVVKRVIKIKWISLVNILLQRDLIEEHIQLYSEQSLYDALMRTQTAEGKNRIANGYQELRDQLKKIDGKSSSDLVVQGLLEISL